MAPTKVRERKTNIVQNLENRQLFGRLAVREHGRPPRLIHTIPKRLVCRLKDIIPAAELVKGHVFLGFLRGGYYLVSYTRRQTAASTLLIESFQYQLQFWLFYPGQELQLVREVVLFDGETTCDSMFITLSQWPHDNSKVLVVGYSLDLFNGENHQSVVQLTVAAVPPLGACFECSRRGPGRSCIPHGFLLHAVCSLGGNAVTNPKIMGCVKDHILVNTSSSLICYNYQHHRRCPGDPGHGGTPSGGIACVSTVTGSADDCCSDSFVCKHSGCCPTGVETCQQMPSSSGDQTFQHTLQQQPSLVSPPMSPLLGEDPSVGAATGNTPTSAATAVGGGHTLLQWHLSRIRAGGSSSATLRASPGNASHAGSSTAETGGANNSSGGSSGGERSRARLSGHHQLSDDDEEHSEGWRTPTTSDDDLNDGDDDDQSPLFCIPKPLAEAVSWRFSADVSKQTTVYFVESPPSREKGNISLFNNRLDQPLFQHSQLPAGFTADAAVELTLVESGIEGSIDNTSRYGSNAAAAAPSSSWSSFVQLRETTLDLDLCAHLISEKFCRANQKRLIQISNYDGRIVDFCPYSRLVTASLCIQLESTTPQNFHNYRERLTHIYELFVIIRWSVASAELRLLQLQHSLTTLDARRRVGELPESFKDFHRCLKNLREEKTPLRGDHLNMLSNAPFLEGKSVSWFTDPDRIFCVAL